MVDLRNDFQPDYAIPPGEILEYELESRAMSISELASRAGITPKHIINIINARVALTPNIAIKLEPVLGKPLRYWLNLEALYQENLARTRANEQLGKDVEWLKRIPLTEMRKFEFVKKFTDPKDQLAEVLKFFGVASVEQWQAVWSKKSQRVAYRQTQRYEILPEAVTSWLRQGEICAAKIQTQPYNKARFKAVLSDIRSITLVDVDNLVDKVTSLCASAGVAVVFVPMLPKTGKSGATFWLSDKPVIMLSLRYKSNDHLWFTFFHEAGHILLHGKKAIFLESPKGPRKIDVKEREANEFAEDILIPGAKWQSFIEGNNFTEHSIKLFADQIGIASGIVVGRLQRKKLLEWNRFNDLKVRYEWT